LTSILEKRSSLHHQLKNSRQQKQILEKQVESMEQLVAIGAAAGMIAHEINNLLTPIGSYAELALRNINDKELVQKALQRGSENCQKASKVVEAILNTVSPGKQTGQSVNISELVDEVFACLCRDFSKDAITVRTDIDKDLTVFVVPVKLQQVLMNLILNARDAMLQSGGGILTISAKACDGFVLIKVSDTGCGIKRQHLGKIFNMFFSTKTTDNNKCSQSGSGLGLAFCKKVIAADGGTISVESEPGAGSIFTIKLPNRQ